MSAGHDFEEVESLPWSSLVAEAKPRPLLAYVAGGVLVALALGLLAGRTLVGDREAGPVATEPAEVVSTIAAPAEPPVASRTTTAQPPPAHLALAEWFVTDYFTVDGDDLPNLALFFRPGFPEAVVPTATYVEWARAWAATSTSEGSEVTVVFRTITALSDGFARDPVRAVTVPVRRGDPPSVAGLPSPAIVEPGRVEVTGYPLEVSDAVADEARERLGAWGTEAFLVGARDAGEDWLVLARVSDERGNEWPLIVPIKKTGNLP